MQCVCSSLAPPPLGDARVVTKYLFKKGIKHVLQGMHGEATCGFSATSCLSGPMQACCFHTDVHASVTSKHFAAARSMLFWNAATYKENLSVTVLYLLICLLINLYCQKLVFKEVSITKQVKI